MPTLAEVCCTGTKISAGSEEEGQYLIDADGLFLKDVLGAVDFTYFRKSPNAFKLGSINKDKTQYRKIKNYEENTNVTVGVCIRLFKAQEWWK